MPHAGHVTIHAKFKSFAKLFRFCTVLLALLMKTAKFMLCKRPALIITVDLFFLLQLFSFQPFRFAQKLWRSECRSQAWGNGEGCGRKGSRRKNIAKYVNMRNLSFFTRDRSGPGRKTTVTCDLSPRVTGGHATWVQRKGGKQWRKKKERNEERKKAKKIMLKVDSSNVGTMTGKGLEVADFMKRRRVDLL